MYASLQTDSCIASMEATDRFEIGFEHLVNPCLNLPHLGWLQKAGKRVPTPVS
jgi:hypothetical protein